jgi:hypothetical protein
MLIGCVTSIDKHLGPNILPVPFWAKMLPSIFHLGPPLQLHVGTWRLTVTELRQRLAPDARLVLAGCYANDGYTMTPAPQAGDHPYLTNLLRMNHQGTTNPFVY